MTSDFFTQLMNDPQVQTGWNMASGIGPGAAYAKYANTQNVLAQAQASQQKGALDQIQQQIYQDQLRQQQAASNMNLQGVDINQPQDLLKSLVQQLGIQQGVSAFQQLRKANESTEQDKILSQIPGMFGVQPAPATAPMSDAATGPGQSVPSQLSADGTPTLVTPATVPTAPQAASPAANVPDAQKLMMMGAITNNSNLTKMGEALSSQQQQKSLQDRRFLQDQVKEYSGQIESKGLADLVGSVEHLDNLMPAQANMTAQEGVPGIGPINTSLPDFLMSKEGKNLRQALATVRNSILRARSGQAVTEGEANRMMEEIGVGAGRTADQLRTGIANVKLTLAEKVKNIQAGVTPEAIEAYKKRGGTITMDRLKNWGVPPELSAKGITTEDLQDYHSPKGM